MTYLYYDMSVEIRVGRAKFTRVNKVSIKESIKELSDTAKITVPRELNRMEIDQDDEKTFEGKNITEFIKVGDPVEIKLGYDGKNLTEFTGYLTKIGADVPLVLECEDEMYQLRQNNFTRNLEGVTLLELLGIIAPGYDYEVIDDIPLGKFNISNSSGYEVLEALRKYYGLHSRFKDGKLVVGFPVDISPQETHQFQMNRNVRAKSNNLKFVKKEDFKVLLKAISINGDGKRLTENYGDQGGAERTLHFTDKTQSELKNLVEKNYKSLSFDGYQGKLPGWGRPKTKPGDAVEITDPNYTDSERDGKYLIEAVETKFNRTDGFMRENTLGMSL